MFFFEPYTPGELTFYALLFGGYKLHKKARKKMQQLNEAWEAEQSQKRFSQWLSQLKIRSRDDYERMNKLLFNAYMKGQISFHDWKQKTDALLKLFSQLESGK